MPLRRQRLLSDVKLPGHFDEVKINDTGIPFTIHHGHKDVGRFQITMNDSFLMGVPDGTADLQKQFETIGHSKLLGGAELRDG